MTCWYPIEFNFAERCNSSAEMIFVLDLGGDLLPPKVFVYGSFS